MDRRTIIIGVAILVLIIILGYFMMKKPVNETTGIYAPEITFTKSSYTINPSKVETYVIEDYTVQELSSYVDVSVNWRNQRGFENVTDIKVERYVTPPGGTPSKKPVETITKTRPAGSSDDYYGWFQNFSKTDNTCTFTNEVSSVKYNAIGKNTFKFYYKRTGETEYSEISTGFTDLSVTLNVDEIQLAVDEGITKTVIFVPNVINVTKSTEFSNEPVYFSSTYGSDNVSLNAIINGQVNSGFDILLSSDATTTTSTSTEADADTVVLRKQGTQDFVQPNLSLGPRGTAIKLSIIEYSEKEVILGQLDAVGEITKVIVYGPTSSTTESFKLVDFNTINNEKEYNSMRFTFSITVPDISADCKLTLNIDYGCNTGRNSIDSGDVTHDRGQHVKRYTVQSKAFGETGKCVTPDGINVKDSNASWREENEYIYTFKDCPVPKTWYLKSDVPAKCASKLGNYYYEPAESANKFLDESEAYDFKTNLHGGSAPPGPGHFNCTVIIPPATNPCPAPGRNPGACVYSASGSSTQGKREFKYTNNNNNDCIHRTVPSGTTIEIDPSCGPQCHTPYYKVKWAGCDSDLGEESQVIDTKYASRKAGQPICGNATDKHGWYGYQTGPAGSPSGGFDVCIRTHEGDYHIKESQEPALDDGSHPAKSDYKSLSTLDSDGGSIIYS